MTGRFLLIAFLTSPLVACMSETTISEDQASAYLSVRSYQTRPFVYATQSVVRGDAEATPDLFDASPVVVTRGTTSITSHHPISVNAEAVEHFSEVSARTADQLMRRLDIDRRVEIDIFVVPEGYRANRRVHFLRLPRQTIRLRFYVRDISILNSPVSWSQSISHEMYHVVRSALRYSNSGWARVIEETSASLLPLCAQLDEFGFANWQSGANGSFTDNGRIERAYAPLSDALLQRWLAMVDRNDEESRDTVSPYIGAMTLWAEVSGSRWEIRAGTEAADRLNAVCELVVDDRSVLPDLLREMASDGVDVATMPPRPRESVHAPYAVPIERD